MNNIPMFWKTTLTDIDETLKDIKCGKVVSRGESAGGRPIYLIEYGRKNDLRRTANFSSALGGLDRKCYADKSGPDYRPTILLVGCIHGGEFEGVAALNNLIKIFETGTDFKGEKNEFLHNIYRDVNVLIIPCLNPDGRARLDFPSMAGKSFEEMRYFNQGTWKDGTLCGWPECKRIHPIKDYCKFLGAYFNDDGVNLMHDDFFLKKSSENEFLFEIVDEYVPDFTILLHGGENTRPCVLKPAHSPMRIKKEIEKLDIMMKDHCEKEGIYYYVSPFDIGEEKSNGGSFNLTSALYHMSGEPCVTYESNQGLIEAKGDPMTYDEIYKAHMILFEQSIKYIQTKKEEENEK